MQNAKRVRRIVLSSDTCLVLTYFITASLKRHDFSGGGGDVTEYKMCLLVFSATFSKTFPILRRTEQYITINEQLVLV
jgi:hypothetical protein